MNHRMDRIFCLAVVMSAISCNVAMATDWQTPQQVAAVATAPAANTVAPAATPDVARFYQITKSDVAAEIVRQLQLQGVEKKATATISNAENTVIYSADHPLQLVIHGLQIDPGSHRWQAQANILNAHQTEIVKPVSGFYEAVVTVPMLVHTVGRMDVIAATDLTMRDIPERQLRKDTITDVQALIGKSPRVQISAERAIRSSEISAPVVIKRGELVEMSYSAPYMHIKTTGIAMDDGELGGMLRVKNAKTEKSISTRVIGAGKVEANLEARS